MMLKTLWSQIQSSNNWKIAKKIGYGYTIAIGIAVVGGLMGLAVGDYYQQQADQRLHWAEEQKDYLKRLDNAILNIRSHPQQLLRVLEDNIWFEYETREFLSNVSNLKYILKQLDEFIKENPKNFVVSVQDFQELKTRYIQNIEAEQAIMVSLWERINPLNVQSTEVSTVHLQVVETITNEEFSQISLEFERLYEDLIRMEQAAQKQQELAIAERTSANRLRLYIILGSFGIAIALATLLAWLTSQAIARPLETVTEIAREVTKNANFGLRAPITTQDEIGILAHSLNQLIAWVEEYTDKLEQSQLTQEHRVEERTQELQETLHNLKNTQLQLIQTEKMSSLGQMVAGVAHEINNPVSFIHGNLSHLDEYIEELFQFIDLLQQHIPENSDTIERAREEMEFEFLRSDIQKILESMKLGSNRIKAIVLSLRNFSRLDESDMKEVDIHEGIDNTLTILNHRLKQNVQIIKHYGSLPLVNCYPAQLNQVFMNLIANAVDAMEEADIPSKQIVITTEKVGDDSSIHISFQDNGKGMSAETQEKIFDPFFTTKPIGKGTGLGLGICYQIVQKHKGAIAVYSELGQGTTFVVTLPLTARSAIK